MPKAEEELLIWAWRASIIPWEKSVASMRAGWASEGRAETRAKEAVPIPQALSWMIVVGVIEGMSFGRKDVKTLLVEFPVWLM